MSKRTRGTRRPAHRRPGTRPASSASSVGGRAARTTRTSSQETIEAPEAQPAAVPDPAADEAQVVLPRPAAVTTSRSAHPRVRAKPGSLLAAKAATEYVYVGQDLRRIAKVAALLATLLIGLWVVLVIMGTSALY